MSRSNVPSWDDIATEVDRYEVGGGSKTSPRWETVWQVFGHEVRVRIRRHTRNGRSWQYYVNANCRGGQRGMNQTNILEDPDFRRYLDVRCPTADDDMLQLLHASISAVTELEVIVSTDKFMPVQRGDERGGFWVNAGWRDYS